MRRDRNRKRETGITMLALAVTIIIIIILSTVTIGMIFGDNGIISGAKLARDMNANSTILEQEEMNALVAEYDSIMKGERRKWRSRRRYSNGCLNCENKFTRCKFRRNERQSRRTANKNNRASNADSRTKYENNEFTK